MPPSEPSEITEDEQPSDAMVHLSRYRLTSGGYLAPDLAALRDQLSEDATPQGGLNALRQRPRRWSREDTRTSIAWAMIFILGAVVVIGVLGWWFQRASTERMESLAVMFAPIVTLVGTVLGFYFSDDR